VNTINAIATQLNRDKKALLIISGFSIFLILASKAISMAINVPVDVLFRDTVAVLKGPPYVGAMSGIGFIFWAMSAAISLFCFFSCKDRIKSKATANLLLASGALSLILLIDDMFLFHEVVFPSLGIKEFIIYSAYGTLVLAYVIHFRNAIKNTDYTILAASFMFFASSIGSDFIIDHFGLDLHSWSLCEDGFKFFGITLWFTYIATTCSGAIKDRA
jgi:hypothetical protein